MLRRAVPLVVVAEDYYAYNAVIATNFAIDAVFKNYDATDPGTHTPVLTKPITAVTLVVTQDFLKYRNVVEDAAAASGGALRIEVLPTIDKGWQECVPDLDPEKFELTLPPAPGDSDEKPRVLRFAILINCSQRLHNACLRTPAAAPTIIDVIGCCSVSKSVTCDVLYFALVQKLEGFIAQSGNLWLERQYRGVTEAAAVLGSSLRNIAQEALTSITRSRETTEHWDAATTTQWLVLAGVVLASVGLRAYKTMV